MTIIEKTYDWAYQPGKRVSTGYIILHHAAAGSCTADDIHRWHLANKWAGIGYNFFVRKDGSVYRGRPEDAVGAHTVGYNSMSIGICFEGNFQTETMPEVQRKAGMELVAYLKGKYPGVKLGKHSDYDSTACPGKNFPFDAIAGVAAAGEETETKAEKEMCTVNVPVLKKGDESGYVKTMQILLNKYNSAGLDEDGDFGPATDKAVKAYQTAHKLDADGICGAKTWAVLVK